MPQFSGGDIWSAHAQTCVRGRQLHWFNGPARGVAKYRLGGWEEDENNKPIGAFLHNFFTMSHSTGPNRWENGRFNVVINRARPFVAPTVSCSRLRTGLNPDWLVLTYRKRRGKKTFFFGFKLRDTSEKSEKMRSSSGTSSQGSPGSPGSSLSPNCPLGTSRE